MKNNFRLPKILLTFCILLPLQNALCESSLLGLNTSGTVYEINTTTGALTQKANDQITSFELGATARKKSKFYYVAAPAGTTKNAIYHVNTAAGDFVRLELDRDDDVRALFFEGKNLYGVFYNASAASFGIYLINPGTGVTKLKVDLSAVNAEPVDGAIARLDGFLYLIVKPSADKRQLLRFKLKSKVALLTDIVSPTGTPVLCDRIKPDPSRKKFVCVASTTSSQVDVASLGKNGVARIKGTLTSLLRIANGHTLVFSGLNYYIFGYAPNEINNQRLVKFRASGKELAAPSIETLIVGARFGPEDDEVVPAS